MNHILVIDDEQAVLDVILQMLLLQDYEVTALNDSRKALELLVHQHYDLIITDLRMPNVDGFEIARAAKRQNPKTPVILHSGYAAECDGKDLNGKGIDLLLHKPVTIQLLFESLDGLLSKTGKSAIP